ncbi:MAG: ABC transporter permease [Armatimonadetes bacterium]|nr:ABC transporter permease [Armatimonadota bacterium]
MREAGVRFGLLCALIGFLCLTLAVFGFPVVESVQKIGEGAFGSRAGFARTMVQMTPLLLAGCGMVVAWRAGMYNIGGEGQYLCGGMAAASLFKLFPAMPPQALSIGILISGVIGGGAYGWLAGWLYVRRGVQVVISTILMNVIAVYLLDYLVTGPLQESKHQNPQSDRLPELAMLAKFDLQTDFHSGMMVAILVAVAVWFFLYRTVPGFKLRVVGENPRVARANLIPAERVQLQSMMLSGGLCGLAGAVQYSALVGYLSPSFAENWGFLAIPVALLGGLHPIGVIGSSLYFGALLAGTDYLSRSSAGGKSIIFAMQGMAVLAYLGFNYLRSRRAQFVGAES